MIGNTSRRAWARRKNLAGARRWIACLPILLAVAATPAAAQADQVDSGDTAWLLTATALVLFMTIPGLALF